MRTAASNLCNINIFDTCLTLVASLCCLQLIGASIECHKHVQKDGFLGTLDGEYEMETCESSSSICYESYVTKKDTAISNAIYNAGCSDCTKNPDEKCRTCKSAMCNDVFATQIKAKNRQCITDGDESSFGSKTVHCAADVTGCYIKESQGDNGPFFHAGCGQGNYPKSRHCSADLCNKPSSLKVRKSVDNHLKKLPVKPTLDNQQGGTETPDADKKPDEANVDAPTTDKETATPTIVKRKRAQESEDFYDNSSDTPSAAVWSTWTLLSIIVMWIRIAV